MMETGTEWFPLNVKASLIPRVKWPKIKKCHFRAFSFADLEDQTQNVSDSTLEEVIFC
jgi:hypothetical protein